MPTTNKSHQQRLIDWLSKEVGGAGLKAEQIREFSSILKNLEIIDLSISSNAEWVLKDASGQQVLIQLVSWFHLGLLQNINIIKQTIKDNR